MRLRISELIVLIKLLEQTLNVNTNIQINKKDKNITPSNRKYNVILTSVGKNKINIIKEIKNLLNLGLKESRDYIETLPKLIKEGIEETEANTIKKRLESLDATIEVT